MMNLKSITSVNSLFNKLGVTFRFDFESKILMLVTPTTVWLVKSNGQCYKSDDLTVKRRVDKVIYSDYLLNRYRSNLCFISVTMIYDEYRFMKHKQVFDNLLGNL